MEATVDSIDFLIRSEDDFLNFLEEMKAREGLDSKEFIFPNVKFAGWPSLDINVKGERYHSSITSAMFLVCQCSTRRYSGRLQPYDTDRRIFNA
ncbi:hypothetical protein ODZ28_26255 [Escherichia coli]|uniref:hypothetical protein n=1 Tax=Escherichia coli TaxID=562 RepID=UPI00201B1FAE|nr:hypothetical protein [Escherichia coli]MCV9147773.1 hypothetical protein [Escherichia coli]MCV9152928.1 hypothetical protein [Escherichia coli]